MTSSDAFGIYVHWPFCKAKCPYCDFNSHVRHEAVDALSFAGALGAELAWFAERTKGRSVTSIFFGGGTPSLMPPEAVGHVLDTIANLWSVSAQVETTLEANPTSIEAGNFRGYRAAGREIDSSKLAGMKSMGLIKRHGQQLMATADGRKLLNAVIAELAS